MQRIRWQTLLSFFLFSSLAGTLLIWPGPARLTSPPQPGAKQASAALRAQVVNAYAKLPLRFEQNRGQADPRVRFVSRGAGYSVFLTPTEAVVTLRSGATRSLKPPLRESAERRSEERPDRTPDVIRLRLAAANPTPQIEGREQLAGASNYLIGNDPSRWHTKVPAFAKVRYEAVYPGVDLVYYGSQQQLEYDLIVAPGADPKQIQLDVSGADSFRVDDSGDLVLGSSLRLRKPAIYQETPSGRRSIAGSYVLLAARRVGFRIGDYDARRPLIIDPVLAYSTYLGGIAFEEIRAIGLDASGNIYVAGTTTSPDFPTASAFGGSLSGLQDGFVSKLAPDGSALIFSTFLGGANTEEIRGLAVDGSGTVTIAGSTDSTNFPTSGPFQASNRGGSDAFVARLNEAGSGLLFSTYLGGSANDYATSLAVDPSGSAYVAGYTISNNFPVASPSQAARAGDYDVFVSKLSAGGNALAYSTYLGGSSTDAAFGIAVDSSGNAYVTGYTLSTNFPALNAFQPAYGGGTCFEGGVAVPCYDAFVTKLSSTGARAYSTYLGGNNDDGGNAIAVDSSGSAYVAGFAVSANFPVASPLQAAFAGVEDGFVAKLAPSGSSLVYSTYLGGTVFDTASAITVDGSGNAYVTGETGSSDFPLVNSMQERNGFDTFVAKMNPGGSGLIYSTYLGGDGEDTGYAIALDGSGNAFVAGGTNSDDFPLKNALQGGFSAAVCGSTPPFFLCPDGFISKIVFQPGLFPGGVVSAASFAPGAAVAAGSIAAAFGSDLTSTVAGADSIPLPKSLGGVSLRMNGVPVPLFSVSGGQMNLQIPWELAGQSQAQLVVSQGGTSLAPITVFLAPTAPGIFTINSQGTLQGAILIAATGELAAPTGIVPGRDSRPAHPGEPVTIYCTGLGSVTNQPASGFAALPAPSLSETAKPTVTIGGLPATVSFSGLTPGLVGLYQVNAQVPTNAPTGNAVSVAISIGGVPSNTALMAVQ